MPFSEQMVFQHLHLINAESCLQEKRQNKDNLPDKLGESGLISRGLNVDPK